MCVPSVEQGNMVRLGRGTRGSLCSGSSRVASPPEEIQPAGLSFWGERPSWPKGSSSVREGQLI